MIVDRVQEKQIEAEAEVVCMVGDGCLFRPKPNKSETANYESQQRIHSFTFCSIS